MPNLPMIFKPWGSYPTSYDQSLVEIELKCDCHKGWISGYARRTGLTVIEEWPVYKIFSSRHHPELIDTRVALSPSGFVNPINVTITARARNRAHVRH